ncbi:ribosome-binding factor A [bacterium]|nr:ribosome-binding factor A [bacterium]
MSRSAAAEVKRERRKSLFLQEFSVLFQDLYRQEPAFADIFVSKVDLSNDTGVCYVYFSAFKEPGEEIFNKALHVLKLYKPSLRKAFAARVKTRYAPDLVFVYDKAKEKERRINDLLDKVAEHGDGAGEPPSDN